MESFENYRSYLFAVAYRMLGSAMDAEDMVQETFVRAQATPPETIRSPKAYLTTVVTRFQPFECAVFLLRESFGYEFSEIAQMLGKGEAACRRSFSRAKQHLHAHRPRFAASPETHQQLLSSFIRAVEQGEMQTLTRLLAEDVTLWADAGGKRQGAALHPSRGRDAVARFSVGTLRFVPAHQTEFTEVNSQKAVIIRAEGHIFSVLTIEADAGRIQSIYVIGNPDKLAHVVRDP